MAYSYNEVVATGAAQNVAVPPYIDQAHIKVSVNGVDTASFSWVNSNTISATAAAGAKIRVYRSTSPGVRLVDYMDGAGLPESVLDTDSLQAFYLAQEEADGRADINALASSFTTAIGTAQNAATAASTSAGNAATSEANALGYKNAAGTSASNAATSESNAANSAAAAALSGYPVGMVGYFTKNTPPAGFIKSNGAAISRTTFAALFAVIGTTFGAGDGSTTFNVPDMRGEFPRGWDDSRGIDAARVFGSLQLDAFQGHIHPAGIASTTGSIYNAATRQEGAPTNTGSPISDGSSGSPRTAAETRPRNVALLACIKF